MGGKHRTWALEGGPCMVGMLLPRRLQNRIGVVELIHHQRAGSERVVLWKVKTIWQVHLRQALLSRRENRCPLDLGEVGVRQYQRGRWQPRRIVVMVAHLRLDQDEVLKPFLFEYEEKRSSLPT